MNLETMKSQFTGEYRDAFDGAYKYILTQSFPASYSDEKMAELYDLLLTAQEEGKPAEKIVGGDIAAFCKEYFSDFEPENRLVGVLGSLFGVACVMLFFSLVDWLFGEEVPPFTQFRLNASPIFCGIVTGMVLNLLFRAVQPVVMKTKKISAGGWAVIYCVVLVVMIGAATALLHGRELSLPGAPFLIGAAVYIVLYLIISTAIRYRKTGSILKKKADNPYKDSYYKNLEDKDLRRIVEKQWLKRYRKLAKRGKVTEESFRDEITRLEKINRIGNRFTDILFPVVVIAGVWEVSRESGVIDTLVFALVLGGIEYLIWLLFHKANLANEATRQHILADCDASGMTLPAFLEKELEVPQTE